jgi:hypothetical protein
MPRGINTNRDPNRRVDRRRFTDKFRDYDVAKAGTTRIDRPRAQAGFMGWMEAYRIPTHVTTDANRYPDSEVEGRPAGAYQRRTVSNYTDPEGNRYWSHPDEDLAQERIERKQEQYREEGSDWGI